MKTCPFCAEEIQDAAIVCKHCGRDLEPKAPVPAPAAQTPAPAAPQRSKKWMGAVGFFGLAVSVVGCISSGASGADGLPTGWVLVGLACAILLIAALATGRTKTLG